MEPPGQAGEFGHQTQWALKKPDLFQADKGGPPGGQRSAHPLS